MARPSKSIEIIKLEGKSHRTKAEIEQRENAEKALLTGAKMKEKEAVKQNIVAHREFLRLKKLLAAIDKDDGLQENIVNRYCQLYAECLADERKRDMLNSALFELEAEGREMIAHGEISRVELTAAISTAQAQVERIEKLIATKREMMLRIEKESLMTTAAALRSITKNAPEKKDENGDMFG